ncbi:hypothetical protein GCM10023193_71910 [Planotetraspora kaengkrachanensis]|uniref:Uncharacterized protein n=1 Tax=Planotetraspora kaengkrachanensis TaxID=575193 RepID=A0A8J3PZM5_9ACTN|nr:hypothetical protein Pka01_70270 [Planotetraspora kaengkrachanensis]
MLVGDINREAWTWNVRRQTTPSPGGVVDKGTKGKRARTVPLIAEVRDLIAARLDVTGPDPDSRLFTGPRGGRITTAVLRDATHWDDVVTQLGYDAMIYGIPVLPGWPTPACQCMFCERSRAMDP